MSSGPMRTLTRFRGYLPLHRDRSHFSVAHCESSSPNPLGRPDVFQWKSPYASVSRRLRRLALDMNVRLGRVNMEREGRVRVVVLGTGWSSVNFIRTIDPTHYDVTVVSPRDYFTFSPLLPSVCGGALSGRSAMEPIRDLTMIGGKKAVEFYEATAEEIDVENKTVQCRGVNDNSKFNVPYDYLVCSVGAETNTFGIPGVEEHAYFLKEVEHAECIRNKLMDNLEAANLPTLNDDERRRLLHFVVVGGGPTGVETAAEISDYVIREARRHYPRLASLVKISLVEMLPKLLPTFDPKISKFTVENFRAKLPNVDVCLNSTVTGITPTHITIKQKSSDNPDTSLSLPYGLVLWASGVGQVPLNKKLMNSLDAQRGGRWLRVDEHLGVIGARDIFALGDCAMVSPSKPSEAAEILYKAASTSPSGAGTTWLKQFQMRLACWKFPHLDPSFANFGTIEKKDNLSLEAFKRLLMETENAYRPPPPTAQNAKQAGKFLGAVFNDVIKGEPTAEHLELPVYCPVNKGQLAYIGNNRGVGQINIKIWNLFERSHLILGHFGSGWFWKAAYWSMSYSTHNMCLQVLEYARTALRGRDSSRPHLVERQKLKEEEK